MRLADILVIPSVVRRGDWGPRLLFAIRRVGGTGWFAIVAFGFLAGYYLLGVRPTTEKVEQLRLSASELTRQSDGAKALAEDPAEQLAAFYATVPAPEDVPDALQSLFDLLREEGLSQEQGSFELKRSPNDRFVRYEMSLPVKGTYPQVRRFLAKAFGVLPTLAVDDIQFSRPQVADALVECRLSLSLYLIDRKPRP